MLERARGVAKAEWHDLVFEQSHLGAECCFPFLSYCHTKEVVAVAHIEFREVLCFTEAIQELCDYRKGVAILRCEFV
jgi:hypothetical protein